MKARAKVNGKGQITIPLEVRRRLGLIRRDEVEFVVEPDVIVLRPVRGGNNPFAEYVGALGSFDDATKVNAWLHELRTED